MQKVSASWASSTIALGPKSQPMVASIEARSTSSSPCTPATGVPVPVSARKRAMSSAGRTASAYQVNRLTAFSRG